MKVIVNEWMSLDGVVQGPTSPDEDRSGGFDRGGWHVRYFDDVARQWAVDGIANAAAFLLGRRTYEMFAAHWPDASEEEQVLARPLNTRPKYVASTTLTAPLAWEHATLLHGDVAEAVAALKRDGDGDLLVIGSPTLVHTLIEHDLVDEYRLLIDPIVVGGGGKRLFRDGQLRSLQLAHSRATTTGALIATYVPDRG